MKKILALILASLTAFSMASCAGPATSSSSASQTGSAADSKGSTSGEPVKVTIELPSMNNLPGDEAKKAVNDALSKYVQSKGFNIAVDVEPSSFTDYTTSMNMRLAGSEVLDIIYTGSINTAVSNGYLVNLDQYKDNVLAGAMKIIGNWDLNGMVNGSLYGIPAYKGLSLDYKYIYNQDYFKDFDMTAIKNINDLDALFAKFKQKYPNELPAANAYWTCFPLYCEQDHTAAVGTYFATKGSDTKLVNMYETDAYKKSCDTAYRWRNLGYVDPEGSAQTISHDAFTYSGACKGVIMGHAYSIDTINQMFTMNNTYGATFKAVSIGNSSLTSDPLTYGIAYTSKHPKEAAQLLNLLWTDEFVMSTVIYGLEGVSWEWKTDKSSIKYPDGLGLDKVPYTCLYSCGAFGNQFLLYGMDGNTSNADKDYMKHLIDTAWVAPLFGFTPSSDKVSTQVASISSVVTQYDKALRYGDVDPSTTLPEFLSALKTAGIDDVMADYQKQVDDWVSKYKK